jgi:hypothetical protein
MDGGDSLGGGRAIVRDLRHETRVDTKSMSCCGLETAETMRLLASSSSSISLHALSLFIYTCSFTALCRPMIRLSCAIHSDLLL